MVTWITDSIWSLWKNYQDSEIIRRMDMSKDETKRMTETEMRFLKQGQGWRGLGSEKDLQQGYLSTDPDRVVRVRLEGGEGRLTVKGRALWQIKTRV